MLLEVNRGEMRAMDASLMRYADPAKDVYLARLTISATPAGGSRDAGVEEQGSARRA
jgi:hypothetical protein